MSTFCLHIPMDSSVFYSQCAIHTHCCHSMNKICVCIWMCIRCRRTRTISCPLSPNKKERIMIFISFDSESFDSSLMHLSHIFSISIGHRIVCRFWSSTLCWTIRKSNRKGLIVMDFHFISNFLFQFFFPFIINIIISVSIWFSRRCTNGRKGRATWFDSAKRQVRTIESIKNEMLLHQTYNLEKCLWIFLWNKLLLAHNFSQAAFQYPIFQFPFFLFSFGFNIVFVLFMLCYLSYKSHFER